MWYRIVDLRLPDYHKGLANLWINLSCLMLTSINLSLNPTFASKPYVIKMLKLISNAGFSDKTSIQLSL